MTSAATAPDRRLTRRSRAVLATGAAALLLGLAPPGSPSAGAQLIPSTTEPPATSEPVPETTGPPETTAAPTTAPPATAPPTTAPPATRAPATTSAPTTTAPPTTTTAPPSAPPTIPVTTVPVEGRAARITQDTPDLGGVLTLWGLGIVGTLATLAWGWWRTRP